MTFTVTPLDAPLGAEVRGFDFVAPVDPDGRAALIAAIDEHLVLLFHNGDELGAQGTGGHGWVSWHSDLSFQWPNSGPDFAAEVQGMPAAGDACLWLNTHTMHARDAFPDTAERVLRHVNILGRTDPRQSSAIRSE